MNTNPYYCKIFRTIERSSLDGCGLVPPVPCTVRSFVVLKAAVRLPSFGQEDFSNAALTSRNAALSQPTDRPLFAATL